MSQSVPIDPRASMRAQLAYTIRIFRELRGLSQEQLAKELYATRASIQAYESQRNRPDKEFCEQLDDFFGTREMFQSLCHHSRREHLHEWFEDYVRHETEAGQVKTFQPMNIPGLLQTERYMRAGAVDNPQGAADVIAARLARRDIFMRDEDPPFLLAILDEAAIDRPVGGVEAMKEQLQYLLDMGKLPNVTIQVVNERVGWYAGLDGALVILTKRDGTSRGYVEAQFGGRLIEDRVETMDLGIRFDRIRAKAMSEDASAALIGRTMEAMQGDPVAEE